MYRRAVLPKNSHSTHRGITDGVLDRHSQNMYTLFQVKTPTLNFPRGSLSPAHSRMARPAAARMKESASCRGGWRAGATDGKEVPLLFVTGLHPVLLGRVCLPLCCPANEPVRTRIPVGTRAYRRTHMPRTYSTPPPYSRGSH